MEKIKGVITGKSSKDGYSEKTKKNWKRFEFIINNKKYSTFDEGIGDHFNVGDPVEMEGEQKGDYWNMKTMVLLNKDEPVPVEKPGEVSLDKDRLIVRQCCLKCACEVICTIPEERRKDIVDAITTMADKLESWVYR